MNLQLPYDETNTMMNHRGIGNTRVVPRFPSDRRSNGYDILKSDTATQLGNRGFSSPNRSGFSTWPGVPVSARAVLGIVSFCLAMTGVFVGNMTLTMMIGEINRKRKDGEQELCYFGSPFRLTAILAEYRRHYPDGNLSVVAKTAIALAFLGMLTAAVCARVIG